MIRAAVMFCRGLSLDSYAEVDIAPADIIKLQVGEDGLGMAERYEAG